MKTEDKKPRNPSAFAMGFCNEQSHFSQEGMTLRDYFANSAMQGIISNSDTMRELTKAYNSGKSNREFEECISDIAFSYADAMLKQREL